MNEETEKRWKEARTRLSTTEHKALVAHCEGVGMAPYELLWRMIRQLLEMSPLVMPQELLSLEKATSQLRMAGVNLNQSVRLAHAKGTDVDNKAIEAALIEIKETRAAIADLISAVTDRHYG